MIYNIDSIRKEFPALKQQVYGKQLVYFDNAATTLKPQCVIDEIKRYYEHENSNIHRGTHYLSQKATEAFEETRQYIARYLNAMHMHEIVFVRGATEGINLIAHSFSEAFLKEGDEIIISTLEHHSNIVPWQMVCEKRKTKLKIIPLLQDGSIDIEAYKNLFSEKSKLVAITHISNALGVITPLKELVKIAHQHNVLVMVDGAQGIVHTNIDVQELDCDFYCFSGHKIYGPMGIGVLYGKEKWLDTMPPYQGGGEMIKDVSFEKTTWNSLPFKFEAGTPNVSAVLGLRKAIEFVEQIGISQIEKYESNLLEYITDIVKSIEDITIYGTSAQKSGVLSFNIEGVHPYDIGVLLDKMGIAVRTGHHCAQPLMSYFSIPGTVRASFGMYNTIEEIDVFINGLRKSIQMLK
jgi:cysteine desulfurase/selenocysteine lyase